MSLIASHSLLIHDYLHSNQMVLLLPLLLDLPVNIIHRNELLYNRTHTLVHRDMFADWLCIKNISFTYYPTFVESRIYAQCTDHME